MNNDEELSLQELEELYEHYSEKKVYIDLVLEQLLSDIQLSKSLKEQEYYEKVYDYYVDTEEYKNDLNLISIKYRIIAKTGYYIDNITIKKVDCALCTEKYLNIEMKAERLMLDHYKTGRYQKPYKTYEEYLAEKNN